jgi:hypothetical protein
MKVKWGLHIGIIYLSNLCNLSHLSHLSLYGSRALSWALAAFSVHTQSVRLLGGGSARRKAVTYTQTQTHTDIQALSGIRTNDPRVRAGEDGSCLRLRRHCD